MPDFNFRLLGTLKLEKDGEPLPKLRSRKMAGLLAYLLRHNGPVLRSELADIFWPDLPEQRGQRNLSRELSYLSDLLPDCFESDFHSISSQKGDWLWSDVDAFQQLVNEAN